jgi:hypothetical protein
VGAGVVKIAAFAFLSLAVFIVFAIIGALARLDED